MMTTHWKTIGQTDGCRFTNKDGVTLFNGEECYGVMVENHSGHETLYIQDTEALFKERPILPGDTMTIETDMKTSWILRSDEPTDEWRAGVLCGVR